MFFISEEYRNEVKELIQSNKAEKKQGIKWKLETKKSKLLTEHKQLLHGLHKNKQTTTWNLEKKRRTLLHLHPELEYIS